MVPFEMLNHLLYYIELEGTERKILYLSEHADCKSSVHYNNDPHDADYAGANFAAIGYLSGIQSQYAYNDPALASGNHKSSFMLLRTFVHNMASYAGGRYPDVSIHNGCVVAQARFALGFQFKDEVFTTYFMYPSHDT